MSYTLTKLTPNLVVSDVARSIAFYRDVLGFTIETTVPDAGTPVFAWMRRDGLDVFLNARDAAESEYPGFKDQPLGGTLTMFILVEGVRRAHDALVDRVSVVMPLETKWYGMTEFAFTDPDGYIITLAERE